MPDSDSGFYERFLSALRDRYPRTAESFRIEERLTPLLVSAHRVRLPDTIKTQAQEIVEAFWALRNLPAREKQLSSAEPVTPDPGNASVLMSYDFHVDQAGNLRLIEINTNASLSLIVSQLYSLHDLDNGYSKDFEKEILESFKNEFALHSLSKTKPLTWIAIVDENPEAQKLFVEFKFFEELFTKAGLRVSIADPNDLSCKEALEHGGHPIDLVYNRHTDFYLETPQSGALRKAFIEKRACLSPNPHEYRQLADKSRLLELTDPEQGDLKNLSVEHQAVIRRALIPTFEISSFGDPSELWKQKKRFFFKPKRMFGGKAVYKGESISRKTFDTILSENYLAQEIVPAPLVKFGNETPDETYKYDLRFFVYRDKVQLACARIYRGQTTNSSTLGGGAAVIEWI